MKKLLLSLVAVAAGLSASATDYKLVTDASQLEIGASYIIAAKNTATAMGAQSGNFRLNVTIPEVSNNIITITDEAVTPVTLEQSGDTDFPYLLKAGDSYLYSPNTSNHLKETTSATEPKAFTKIDVTSEGVSLLTLNNKKSDNNAVIKYNNSTPRFSCYFTAVQTAEQTALYKEVTEAVVVSDPTFNIRGGNYIGNQNIELTCETEGATIYYTIDGTTTPDETATEYTAAITVTETTTIKAIAIKGADKSDVVTQTYTIFTPYTSLGDLLDGVTLPEENRAYSETFAVGFEPVVAYINGGYIYVTEGGKYTLIYKSNSSLSAGDKVASNWFGRVMNYYGLYEIVPDGTLSANGTAEVPAPAVIYDATTVTLDLMNNIVVLKGITFGEATPSDKSSFTGTFGETELAFYNNFTIEPVETGKYDVTAVVSVYNDAVQFQPIKYNEYVEPVLTYALHGLFEGASWASTDMEENESLWSCTVTPGLTKGEFGIKQITDGTQTGWYAATEAVTITEANTSVTLSLEGLENVAYELTAGKEYTFTFDPATGNLNITFEASPIEPTVPEHLYIFGEIDEIGWNPGQSAEMTKEDNTFTYTGTTNENGNIAIAEVQDADWDVVNAARWCGTEGDGQTPVLGEPMSLVKGSGAIKVTPGTYKFTVAFGEESATLTVTEEAGISDIAAGSASQAEYFNLQGIRVATPTAGTVYIVRRGTTVTKELVK